MPGYKDWIDAIDIKVDYFSAFMKAWIAFNAWYNFSGEVTGNSDKECIEYIASQSNRFKTYTMNLINAEDADGSAYRENIAKLHGSLLNAAIICFAAVWPMVTYRLTSQQMKCINMPMKCCAHR